MKKNNLIQKPFAALAIFIFVVSAILFIQSQKVHPGSDNAVTNSGTLKTDLLNKFNNNSQTGENTFPVTSNSKNSVDNSVKQDSAIIKDKESKFPRAPDFFGIENWINSKPLKIEELRGKVVLVDFWTYTCINCIRTLPYLKDWDKKYRDKGLVIVGVHTPEFDFEKKYDNVVKAAKDYQIEYPIAQDNDYATWGVYRNRYWPHEYLIDIDGFIRHDNIGEGNYDETEMMIQTLLKERMDRMNSQSGQNIILNLTKINDSYELQKIRTPEIYLGYQFSRGNFGNPEGIRQGETIDYKTPSSVSVNYVYFDGKWKNNEDNMELADDEGSILLLFKAKKINIVAGSDNGSNATVYLDNVNEDEKTMGSDVALAQNRSIATINEYKLYNLATAGNYEVHAINIHVKGKGFKLFTFTFG